MCSSARSNTTMCTRNGFRWIASATKPKKQRERISSSRSARITMLNARAIRTLPRLSIAIGSIGRPEKSSCMTRRPTVGSRMSLSGEACGVQGSRFQNQKQQNRHDNDRDGAGHQDQIVARATRGWDQIVGGNCMLDLFQMSKHVNEHQNHRE